MNNEKPTIHKQLEQIASEICDHYCKWPDETYRDTMDDDTYMAILAEEHCNMCPLVQILSE